MKYPIRLTPKYQIIVRGPCEYQKRRAVPCSACSAGRFFAMHGSAG